MVFFTTNTAPRPGHPCGATPVESGTGPTARDDAASAAQGDAACAETRPPSAGVLDELSAALGSARAALLNFLDLISLEARRAALAFMWMVASGVIAAICIVAAWLGLMAALAMWAVSLGLPPIVAVTAVAGINLAAGAVLIYLCIGMSQDLLFSATRRQLAGRSPAKAPAP